MATKETKEQLTKKINELSKVMFALIGMIAVVSMSTMWYVIVFGFFIGGFLGYLIRPYNEKGDHRY